MAKDHSSYGWCILLIFSGKSLVFLYWLVDYPVKKSSLCRGNQEKDTERLCPRWLRLSPERKRRITPSLCSSTNEDWFLEAAAQFPSSIPIPPSSPAVTSAPLHVLSCLCRKARAHACATGARGVLWASWLLLASLASTEPTASGLDREGASGRPEKKLLTFPPSYQIWLELINESGVLLLKEREVSEIACGYLLFIKIKRSGGRNWHIMHNLNKMPGFCKLEVGCVSV